MKMEKDCRPSIPSDWASNVVCFCIVCMLGTGLWMFGNVIQELQKTNEAQHTPVKELASAGTRQ